MQKTTVNVPLKNYRYEIHPLHHVTFGNYHCSRCLCSRQTYFSSFLASPPRLTDYDRIFPNEAEAHEAIMVIMLANKANLASQNVYFISCPKHEMDEDKLFYFPIPKDDKKIMSLRFFPQE